MTNANIYGTTQAKTQPHAWREKANHWWSQIFWQQIWAICVTRTGASPSFLCLIFSHYLKVKHTYFSSQGSIIMSGFQPVIYSSKLTTPLTFLKASQKDGPRAYFSLTMLLAIKSVQMMHSQLGGWSKVHNLCFFLLWFSLHQHNAQPQRRTGYIILVVHACATAHFPLAPHSHFTLQTITPPCPGGLRAWKPSFVNTGFGQNQG